jgi:hypothetical protein
MGKRKNSRKTRNKEQKHLPHNLKTLLAKIEFYTKGNRLKNKLASRDFNHRKIPIWHFCSTLIYFYTSQYNTPHSLDPKHWCFCFSLFGRMLRVLNLA